MKIIINNKNNIIFYLQVPEGDELTRSFRININNFSLSVG